MPKTQVELQAIDENFPLHLSVFIRTYLGQSYENSLTSWQRVCCKIFSKLLFISIDDIYQPPTGTFELLSQWVTSLSVTQQTVVGKIGYTIYYWFYLWTFDHSIKFIKSELEWPLFVCLFAPGTILCCAQIWIIVSQPFTVCGLGCIVDFSSFQANEYFGCLCSLVFRFKCSLCKYFRFSAYVNCGRWAEHTKTPEIFFH